MSARFTIRVNIDFSPSFYMPSPQLDQLGILINNAPVAMALYDTDMRIVHLNQEFANISRLDYSEAKGKLLYELAPDTRTRRHVHDKILSGESYADENVPHQFPDEARPRYSNISYKPLRDGEGNVIGILTTVIDVTAQVHATQDLKALIGRNDDFLDLSAHELRTPITVIKAFAQLAQRPEFNSKQPWLAYAIEVIGKHADHMVNLIHDMLEVSRIGQGDLPLYREQFDLCDLASSLERDYEPLFENCNCTFDIPAAPVMVDADRQRVGTVFANIVDNAGKYAKDKSPCDIKLALKLDGDKVIASVQDKGIGIPQDQQSKIFDRFFRASNVNTRTRNGLGLGLYICKAIVEQHGGRIWVDSDTNKGTTIFFSLPLLAV